MNATSGSRRSPRLPAVVFALLALTVLGDFRNLALAEGRWVFACAPENDLHRVMTANARPGQAPPRFDSPAAAVANAPDGAAVLFLADGYPDRPTEVTPAVLEAAERKGLRLYIEFPAALPGLTIGSPKAAGLQRGVVQSGFFGPDLPPLRIAVVHGCRYVPVSVTGTPPAPIPNAPLVLARVAGVDTAVFGLADTPVEPLLGVHPRFPWLVATTKLSHFVTGRYQPADAWRTIWRTILQYLQPGSRVPELPWTPTVSPTYGPADPLPPDAEARALHRATAWVVHSGILRHPDWPEEAIRRSDTYNTVRDPPRPEWPRGDGSFGLLEGFSSTIRPDGSQPMRYAVRNDCVLETAMMLAFDPDNAGASPGLSARLATNLVEYLFTRSGLATGPRADPDSTSFGLLGWALDSPGSYWGDDNARALLGLMATSVLMKEPRWNEAVARALLANLRTTGRTGFREACVTEPELARRGWRSYWEAAPIQHSPHFQSWLWACYLRAYDQTRFEPLRERSRTGLRALMAAYPDRWDWVLRSAGIERARALLPLAWLVRVEDTPEHRGWLRRVAGDLVALQDASGALRETIGGGGHGTASNAEFGTREASLIQTDGDPVCDLLYTANFALLGLHEAAAATGDPWYAAAEERLARFLCRVQIRSTAHPEFDGAWYRAFDFRRWEYWASNADWEWGPWCIESGWTQPWIAAGLALRQRGTSLWDLTGGCDLRPQFARWRPRLLPDDALAIPPAPPTPGPGMPP